jgi:hypothetical protein
MELFWPKTNKDWKEIIGSLNQVPVLSPFDHPVLSFLQSLSKYIMNDRQNRQNPELIALAYWMRKSNIQLIQNSFFEIKKDCFLRARGTVLQFAPSNVDTIFVYSWVLSLLAGNKSVIRISRKQSDQTRVLINSIIHCLNFPENIEISKRIVILSYDHSENITKYLSENCHVRVIWGGDVTVKTIRSVPLAPLATEIVFPDRFSLSLINASKVLSLQNDEMDKLIHNFYNDSYWYGQMACSSPRIVVWVGNEDCIRESQEKFWSVFQYYISHNYLDFAPSTQVQKLTTSYLLGTEEIVEQIGIKPEFTRIQVTSLTSILREEHCGGGLFLELNINSVNELAQILNDKDQTLSYFGFEKDELISFIERLQNRGIDRIVPVGHALNFEEVWDGYRLLTYFTREIVLK